MPIEKHPFRIHNTSGDEIAGDIRIVAGSVNVPVVIISHGFTGFKDWGSIPYMAEQFALKGFCAVTFNFSHNGVRGDSEEFNAPEMFAVNTVSIELDDLKTVLYAVLKQTILGLEKIDTNNIFMLGHSRGGGISIITVRENPVIRALAVWGSVVSFDRWTQRFKHEWRTNGVRTVITHQPRGTLKMSPELLEDMEKNQERFTIEHSVENLQCPLLIIHGAQDVTVPESAAHRLYAAAKPDTAQLHIIPNTGHTFGAGHPFAEPTPALIEAIDLTVSFFQSNIADSTRDMTREKNAA